MIVEPLKARIRITSVKRISNSNYVFNAMIVKRHSEYLSYTGLSYVTVDCDAAMCNSEPVRGQIWEVYGGTEIIKAEGRRANIVFKNPKTLTMVMAEGGEEFINFIANDPEFRGIGISTARRLFNNHGTELLTTLEQGNLQKLLSLSKVGAVKIKTSVYQSLYDGYKKYENLKYATWFAQKRIPPNIQQRLFKHFTNQAIEQIKSNPYTLHTFGMSFEKVDKIAVSSFGLDLNSDLRLRAIVNETVRIHCSEGGHTAMPLDLLVSKVETLIYRLEGLSIDSSLSVNAERIRNVAIESIVKSKKAFDIHYEEATDTVHLTPLFIMESVVAKRLTSLSQENVDFHDSYQHYISDAAKSNDFPLSSKQFEAVFTAVSRKLSVLTGGAGTGKTTVLKTITKTFYAMQYCIYPIALSGRAAKRLRDSVQLETWTIARFLREKANEVTDKSIIIIDEASMIDIYTMYRLVISTSPQVRFLIVGDDAQLPPIGSGLILSELIKLDFVPHTVLDIVQRQDESTGIPYYTKQIREYQIPESLNFKNIRHHNALPKSSSIKSVCVDLMKEFRSEAQVLCPTNAIANAINVECQMLFNSSSETVFDQFDRDTGFRVNDPVIFTKNDYRIDVQNGTLAKIISLSDTDDAVIDVELDDGRILSLRELDNLKLAYAITLHKSQGSQFERVIVAVTNHMMIDNSWIYTAITRATHFAHMVGTAHHIHAAVMKPSSALRRMVHLSNLMKIRAHGFSPNCETICAENAQYNHRVMGKEVTRS